MKSYVGKTIEEALQAASEELGTPVDELIYSASGKTKGIFSKKVVVDVYDLSDVIKYAEDYILNAIDNLGIESTVSSRLDDDIIRITIDSTHNPILIGVLLDVNGYKDNKYDRLARLARRYAHEVQKTKATYTFDPMPADERRAIHNACSNMRNIRTESIGEGTHRQVQILYVE